MWWDRPTCIEGAARQPAPGLRSSKVSALATPGAVTLGGYSPGAEPPSCSTWGEPSGPAGTGTAVPHTRSRLRLGMSCHENALSGPGIFMNHESCMIGPVIRMRPLGIGIVCG